MRHLGFKEKEDLHSPKMSVSKRQKAEELIQIKGDQRRDNDTQGRITSQSLTKGGKVP